MIISLFFYFLTIFFVFSLIKKNKYKTKPFPKLKINKSGIVFYSNEKHKIKIEEVKLLVLERVAYLKKDNQTVAFYNVEDLFFKEGYLYFKGMGEVKILFDVLDFYRYFNVVIKSNKFSLNKLKQLALIDMLNYIFNVKNSKILKKYINIIKNILKIDINNKKIKIKPNNFNLSYSVFYKLNNRLVRVDVQERI